ncbi:hypothetical protein Tco_0459989 [Tanacetum coccineum]
MSTSTHPIIILSNSDVEDAFFFTDYTPTSLDYSPALLGNTSSDSKTCLRAYYATNEELSDSLSSSTIPPPPAPVCPCRKARLPQPYEPEPFMQPFRYHTNGMTFIHTAQKRVRAPQAHIASPPVFPSPLIVPSSPLSHPRDSVPEEIMSPQKRATSYHHHLPILIFLSHLRKKGDKADNEIVLTAVRIFHSGSNHRGYPDIEHIIPPTPPRDTDPPIGSPIPSSPSSSVGSSSRNCTEDNNVKFATGTLTETLCPGGIHSPQLLEIEESLHDHLGLN